MSQPQFRFPYISILNTFLSRGEFCLFLLCQPLTTSRLRDLYSSITPIVLSWMSTTGRQLPLIKVIAMFPLHHYSSFMSGVFEDATPSNHSSRPFLLRSHGRIGSFLTKSQASNVTLQKTTEKSFLDARRHQHGSCRHSTMMSLLRFWQ